MLFFVCTEQVPGHWSSVSVTVSSALHGPRLLAPVLHGKDSRLFPLSSSHPGRSSWLSVFNAPTSFRSSRRVCADRALAVFLNAPPHGDMAGCLKTPN